MKRQKTVSYKFYVPRRPRTDDTGFPLKLLKTSTKTGNMKLLCAGGLSGCFITFVGLNWPGDVSAYVGITRLRIVDRKSPVQYTYRHVLGIGHCVPWTGDRRSAYLSCGLVTVSNAAPDHSQMLSASIFIDLRHLGPDNNPELRLQVAVWRLLLLVSYPQVHLLQILSLITRVQSAEGVY